MRWFTSPGGAGRGRLARGPLVAAGLLVASAPLPGHAAGRATGWIAPESILSPRDEGWPPPARPEGTTAGRDDRFVGWLSLVERGLPATIDGESFERADDEALAELTGNGAHSIELTLRPEAGDDEPLALRLDDAPPDDLYLGNAPRRRRVKPPPGIPLTGRPALHVVPRILNLALGPRAWGVSLSLQGTL